MNSSPLPIIILDLSHPVQSITPYHDRLTVIPDPMPKFSALGLHIPDTVKDKPYSGTIVRVGSGCKQAKTGQRVIFGKYSGTELTINSEKFLIMHEADLILDLESLTPFADRVLIAPTSQGKELAHGLIVPDNVQEQPQLGIVAAVGSLCQEIKAEDKVLFGKFAGMSITLAKRSYLVMRELDVVGKLQPTLL